MSTKRNTLFIEGRRDGYTYGSIDEDSFDVLNLNAENGD
jgi:hypothetical protein